MEIDMRNSQFAIHAYWLKQSGLCEQFEDAGRYYEICSKGVLYDELASTFNATRDEAKQMMMELAFSSYKYNTATKKKFKQQFPNVVAHIDSFKREEKRSQLFSIRLQQMEAELFVDNLYPNIKDQGMFCLTKHDSLIVKKEDEERVVGIIEDCFGWFGLECFIDVEGKKIEIRR